MGHGEIGVDGGDSGCHSLTGEDAVAHRGGDAVEDELRSTGVDATVCGAGAEEEDGSSQGGFVALCLSGGDGGDGG